MYITWLGHSYFKIQDKIGTEGITVATDPYNKSVGWTPPRFDSDIALISHDHYDHNNLKALRGDPFIVDSAGEYEIKGISIEGIESFHDKKDGRERGKNIIYRIDIDDISVAHLGDLGQELDVKQLEKLVGVDILLVPVGEKYTLDVKQAVETVSQIEPRIVIPMHYKLPGLKVDIIGVDRFVKEIGLKPTKEDKLKISKKDLPQEDMELIILHKQ